MEQRIYILTYRRDRVLTYENLSKALRKRVVFVTDEEDGRHLGKLYPGSRFVFCPEQGTGSANVRQWIVDLVRRQKQKLCIIVDDDLAFMSAHWEEGRKRFRRATDAELNRAFERLEKKARGKDVAFASFSDPFFNVQKEEWALCKYAMCAFFINMETLEKTGARFDGIANRSDLKFMLETWTKGYPSYNSLFLAVKNRGDSGTGGESLRLADGSLTKGARPRGERQEEAHLQLARRFPKYVRLVERTHARAEAIGTKLDARVYGQKAYRDAVANRPDPRQMELPFKKEGR